MEGWIFHIHTRTILLPITSQTLTWSFFQASRVASQPLFFCILGHSDDTPNPHSATSWDIKYEMWDVSAQPRLHKYNRFVRNDRILTKVNKGGLSHDLGLWWFNWHDFSFGEVPVLVERQKKEENEVRSLCSFRNAHILELLELGCFYSFYTKIYYSVEYHSSVWHKDRN